MKFSKEFKKQGYSNPSAVISWSSDIGGDPISKVALFNRDVQSAEISWPGLANAVSYIRDINPNIKINVIAYSLGFDLVAEAASHGVYFNSVIALVPASNAEDISVGGRYEDAIKNIGKLRIVYSKNQLGVFGIAYRVAKFDNALGYFGPSGIVSHPDFEAIDATQYIKGHGDIRGSATVRILIDQLNKKANVYDQEDVWARK